MSLRYKGGVISATPPTTTGGQSGTAKGVWTLEQQLQAQAAGNWPVAPPSAVQVSRSLRFNSADSAYLNRTPASAGNRKTWTWSGWVKRSTLDTFNTIFCGNGGTTNATFTQILFRSDQFQVNGYTTIWRRSTAVYRDTSAWYHLVVAFDTTQATASDRVKLYVNGTQVTSFSISNDPTQNTDYGINAAVSHGIGSVVTGEYFDGYITNVDFIDGQALTPSSFGQTNSTTGVWEPIQTVGYLTYGTNGFHLDFADNSGTTSTTLGKDTSGNSNNWTPNNFSVTAGTGNDSLVDSPTPYGTDTGAGGEVRGNYCTVNPLDTNAGAAVALSNGNLYYVVSDTGAHGCRRSTMSVSSGKWYAECTIATAVGGGGTDRIGIISATQIGYADNGNPFVGGFSQGYAYRSDGKKENNNSAATYGSSYTTNDVIGIALDMDNGTVTFYLNGVSQGQAYSGLTGAFTFAGSPYYGGAHFWNYGQRAFAYTAPSNHKAVVNQNLSTPATVQPDDYFNTVLYTGTGATRSITGVGFAPDFVWNKGRDNAVDHCLNDIVRGANKQLVSNTTGAELTYTNQLTSFDSDGFSLGADNLGYTNYNNVTYVAWNWKANGAGSSNTAGSITSTVSANTTSGFSIATFTSPSSGTATFGHGLGVAPSMIIFKTRDAAANWVVYHKSIGATGALRLNLTSATSTSSNWFNDTAPTSTVATIGILFANPYDLVAYCFAEVAGFSAFGSYTGNGSSTGPFIYTGFRPAMIFAKQTNAGGENWYLMDNKRSAFNLVNDTLYPNSNLAETVDNANVTCDFVANGFKIRDSYAGWNANGGTYIYAAFAENPFKYALAR